MTPKKKRGSMLIVAGIVRLDPTRRAQLDAAFDRMREATLKETGCLEYQAYFDRKDAGVVLIFEKWQNEHALRAHFVTAHVAEFTAALTAAGATGSGVRKYEVSTEGPVI
jgi:quinol monooxygenase YgiN